MRSTLTGGERSNRSRPVPAHLLVTPRRSQNVEVGACLLVPRRGFLARPFAGGRVPPGTVFQIVVRGSGGSWVRQEPLPFFDKCVLETGLDWSFVFYCLFSALVSCETLGFRRFICVCLLL